MITITKYKNRIIHGRTIFIAGIAMLFETVNYAMPVGIFMMISGLLIIKYYKKQILFEKNKEIIIKFLENIITNDKNTNNVEIKKEPKIKEIKVIDVFGRKYQYNNNNINKINLDNIMYYDINYDKITLFLDIYMFVCKFKIIMDLELHFNNAYNNKLLIDYYNHYNNIISYISNITNDEISISIAINIMENDYYTNMKILDKLIRNIMIEKNKEEWLSLDNNTIKLINKIFNNIITENLNNKEKLI
jgi:hypothetical protein